MTLLRATSSGSGLAWTGLVLASLFWAGNALVARAFHQVIPPMSLAFWRWVLALILLLPFIARPLWRQRELLRKAWWQLLILAALSIAGYSAMLYQAAQTTTAINMTLLNTCLPLVLFLGAGIMLGEWPERRAWWGMLLAAGGLLVLISSGSWNNLLALQFTRGDLWIMLSIADWALYSLLLRRWSASLAGIASLHLLGLLIALGIPMLLPFYLLELARGEVFALSAANLAAIAYTALFASLFAYLAWNYGIKVLGASRVALSNYLMPVFAAILSWLLLDEALQGFHWVGAVLIFGGLLVANWKPRHKAVV
ncbi:DMT family transporter [Pseudomonas sp. N040]|uniref:DMT family transporter n=1 Tax=Pseudomonas sp. N040 TaxID=2785325 RepID=UPI0018A30D34|nr:DMT family transporter [Pseudomonas sp. N040]MBF7731212.1 DMT family transporter [Pseudomonas sp. N040]MBW7014855.1 DMT family transporter [Pseudomonas sp. N040]